MSSAQKISLCLLFLVSMTVLVSARPQEFDYDEERQPSDRKDDVARVQIKVYRGPTEADGHAPWGFWVKQPSDDN